MSKEHAEKSAPAAVVVWERRTPVSRDRSRALTRDEVARAGFEVAETENLPAVSIKRIAGRLGIPAVRLENYLLDRSELLDVMVDEALGEIDLDLPDEGDDWQGQMWRLAHATREVVRSHPWLAGLLGLRAASGPNGLRFTEHALSVMNSVGLDMAETAQCVEAVLAYVCGSVRPQSLADSAQSRTSPVALATYLNEQLSPESFPMLSRLLGESATMTGADAFDAGLSYLLTGIATGVAFHRDAEPAGAQFVHGGLETE